KVNIASLVPSIPCADSKSALPHFNDGNFKPMTGIDTLELTGSKAA
ncbi:MAG: hypothetical protein ACI965_000723, partial [Paraglaciecola sp.]